MELAGLLGHAHRIGEREGADSVNAGDVAHRSAQVERRWTSLCCPGSRAPRKVHKKSQHFRPGLVWNGREENHSTQAQAQVMTP